MVLLKYDNSRCFNHGITMKKLPTYLCLSLLLVGSLYAHDPIMSYEEYVTIKHSRPYMYTLLKQDQALFYFGANHSCDSENEQYQQFDYFWNEFLQCTNGENCVVLIEGSLRGKHTTKYDAISKGGGEGGLLQFYAEQQGISAICPEADEKNLQAKLLQYYSDDEVAYRDFAHICMQFHRYTSAVTLDRMKEIHTQIFGTEFDIYDEQFFYEVSNPVDSKTIVNKVCRTASQIRDEAIVTCIADLIKQKKNVFIAYGATHAVMQKAAIKSLWDAEEK